MVLRQQLIAKNDTSWKMKDTGKKLRGARDQERENE